MSEAERPDLLSDEHEVTAEDVRALTGAATPHFALQVRNRVAQMAKMKFDQKGAPVFTYFFTWQSPMLEDAGAWHTAELAFCFDNTRRCEQGTGNTPEAQVLAKRMATAWVNFARTGNPNGTGDTSWPRWKPDGPAYFLQNDRWRDVQTNAQFAAAHQCGFWHSILRY